MTVQITSDQATEGGATGVLADVRRVFNSGRTRPLTWRSEQLRAIERMCDEREPEIAEAIGQRSGPVPRSRRGSATSARPRPRRRSPAST